MIVELAPDQATVADPDNCSELQVTTTLASAEAIDSALRDAGIGRLGDDRRHAFLDVEQLRSRARAGDVRADWDDRWQKMIEFARRNGWLTPDGARVRAHIESP